jgi:NAD(P)-dependent dehydrogenase (short-subunit alcohol dehydrogenase family)
MEPRKSIFITGAASGIGRAVAHSFAARGWFVGLADVNEAGMRETAASIPSGHYSLHCLDVRDRGQWDEALAAFWSAAGNRMDVLFNNAGIGRGGPLAETPPEEDDLVLDVNLRGVIYGAKAGHPYLKQTVGSCLLNTASAAGIVGAAGMSVYCATKFAVRGFTESLDVEWEEDGIKVRSLMPSFIDTPILDHVAADSNRQIRETVEEAGLEISPVSLVVDAVWQAIEGAAVHIRVGKSAKRVWFWQRFAPGLVRKRAKGLAAARDRLAAE